MPPRLITHTCSSDGNKYEGTWVKGVMEGPATLTRAGKNPIAVMYENGKPRKMPAAPAAAAPTPATGTGAA